MSLYGPSGLTGYKSIKCSFMRSPVFLTFLIGAVIATLIIAGYPKFLKAESVNSEKNNGIFPAVGCYHQQSSEIECKVEGLKAGSVKATRASLSYLAKGGMLVEIGVCYCTSRNPSISSGNKKATYKDEPKDVPINVSFKVNLSELEQNTKYYVRAYVINDKMVVTYSDEIEFTTLKEIDFSAMLNGPKTEHYPNGQVMKKYNLKDGKLNGDNEFYSDSGYLISRQAMVDGVANGPLTTYYNNGNKRGIMNYKGGAFTGESSAYYEDGTLKSESKLTGDLSKPTGESKTYYREGGLERESRMSNGEFVYAITYDKEGRVISEQKPGSSVSYHYDADG